MSNSEEPGQNEVSVENEVQVLTSRVKVLEYDCAELQKSNSELQERVKKLASRQPAWPKGYRPQRRHNPPQSSFRPNQSQ